jgi:eukaryotic-like serine/threonine-protein kinase
VEVPSVLGGTPTEVTGILDKLGLVLQFATEPSSAVPTGEVTRTSPPVGAVVDVGSTVTVFVASGPEASSVPALAGDTQAQAQSVLAGVALAPSFTTTPVTDPSQDGLVQSQNPAAGTQATEGSTVQVVVGAYVPPTS